MAVFGFAHKGSLQSTTHIQTTGDAAVSGFSRSLLAAQHQVAAMQQQQPAALHSRGVPQLGGPVAAQAAVDDADSLGQVVPEPGRDKVRACVCTYCIRREECAECSAGLLNK